jgi:hypothetical protein
VIYLITYWDISHCEGNGDYVWVEQFTVGEEYDSEYQLTLWVEDETKLNLETCYEERNFGRLELLDPQDTTYDRINCEIGIDSMLMYCKTLNRWYAFIYWLIEPTYIYAETNETFGEWIEQQRKIIWDNLVHFGEHEVLIFSDQGPLQSFAEDDSIYKKTFEQIKSEMIDKVGKDKTRYLPKELSGYEEKSLYEKSDHFQLIYDDFPEKN